MSEFWETKDGRRRVRRDPPTVEEAVVAAQGLTDNVSDQVQIVASLMHLSADEARGAVLRMARSRQLDRVTITGRSARGSRGGASHAVVVERRLPRRRTVGH